MNKILTLIILLSLVSFAGAEDCPVKETPYGAGFYMAAIEIDHPGTDMSLLSIVCKAKPDGKVVITDSDATLCRAGYYDAMDKKGFALKCLAELPE